MIKIYDEKFYQVNDLYDALRNFEDHRTAGVDWRDFDFKKYADIVIAEDSDVTYEVQVLPEGIRNTADLDAQCLDYSAGVYTDTDVSPQAHLSLHVVEYDRDTGEPLVHYDAVDPDEISNILKKTLLDIEFA